MSSEVRVGLLTVRYESSRLPGKCLLEIRDGMTFLEWSILRTKASGFTPIVCTTTDDSDDAVIEVAERAGALHFRGDPGNKVYRWSRCLREFEFDSAHLIDVDDPFFSLDDTEESFRLLGDLQVDVMLPGKRSESGEATVGTSVRASAVHIAAQESLMRSWNTLDVVPWTTLVPGGKILSFPEEGLETARFRLTLDYPEDLELMRNLAKRFGPQVVSGEVHSFLIQQPELVSLNYFRNAEFVARKAAQVRDLEE